VYTCEKPNINVISETLYNFYSVYVIVGGAILLLAMLGVIILVKKNEKKSIFSPDITIDDSVSFNIFKQNIFQKFKNLKTKIQILIGFSNKHSEIIKGIIKKVIEIINNTLQGVKEKINKELADIKDEIINRIKAIKEKNK